VARRLIRKLGAFSNPKHNPAHIPNQASQVMDKLGALRLPAQFSLRTMLWLPVIDDLAERGSRLKLYKDIEMLRSAGQRRLSSRFQSHS
jgi:hypothetical protein